MHHKFGPQFPTDNSVIKRIEKVQRRGTKWILRTRTSEMTYKKRPSKLELLPLSYDRKIKDLVLFFKSTYGYVDHNINNCVSFIQHTRLSQATGVMLQTLMHVQNCYFSIIIFQSDFQTAWNSICQDVNPDTYSSSISFKNFLKRRYLQLLRSVYDVELSCTWSLVRITVHVKGNRD